MPRPRTDVDRIADAFLDATVELSPTAATYMGIPGHDEDLDDFSPAGHAAHSALRRRTLAALAQASPVDDIDRVTMSAMQERLSLSEEIHAAGLDEMSLDVIAPESRPSQALYPHSRFVTSAPLIWPGRNSGTPISLALVAELVDALP